VTFIFITLLEVVSVTSSRKSTSVYHLGVIALTENKLDDDAENNTAVASEDNNGLDIIERFGECVQIRLARVTPDRRT